VTFLFFWIIQFIFVLNHAFVAHSSEYFNLIEPAIGKVFYFSFIEF